MNIHGNKCSSKEKAKDVVNADERVSEDPHGVGNAYLGFHTAGWGAIAGPRRCRGQRARASHWSTAWMSPLTYGDTQRKQGSMIPKCIPAGLSPLSTVMPWGPTDARASNHHAPQTPGCGRALCYPFWYEPRSKSLHTTGGRQTEMPYHFNSLLLCMRSAWRMAHFFCFSAQTGLTFVRSLDVPRHCFPVIVLTCAHNSDVCRTTPVSRQKPKIPCIRSSRSDNSTQVIEGRLGLSEAGVWSSWGLTEKNLLNDGNVLYLAVMNIRVHALVKIHWTVYLKCMPVIYMNYTSIKLMFSKALKM